VFACTREKCRLKVPVAPPNRIAVSSASRAVRLLPIGKETEYGLPVRGAHR
jgi:hypothetical protein